MPTWTVKLADPIEINCSFQPRCAFHKDVLLELRGINPIMFPIYDNGHRTLAHAVDVSMTCPECGYAELFGVAVSDAEMEAIRGASKKGAA